MTFKDWLVSKRDETEIVTWAAQNMACHKCAIREKCEHEPAGKSCRHEIIEHLYDEVEE